jgi:hypothetical protein
MVDTYETSQQQSEDKARLTEFLDAIDGARNAVRLDECRLWTIRGSHGYVSTWGDNQSFLLFVQCHSSMAWTYMKRRLSFCVVTQDGDDEGCFKLARLPAVEEAEAIRRAVGIHARKPPPVHGYQTRSTKETPLTSGTREMTLPDPSSHLPGQEGESED